MKIIDHKHQLENGKDREEFWIHILIGILKSEYPQMFKNRKPAITKTGDLLEIKGLNIGKEMITEKRD